jgi:hypothetical protein
MGTLVEEALLDCFVVVEHSAAGQSPMQGMEKVPLVGAAGNLHLPGNMSWNGNTGFAELQRNKQTLENRHASGGKFHFCWSVPSSDKTHVATTARPHAPTWYAVRTPCSCAQQQQADGILRVC